MIFWVTAALAAAAIALALARTLLGGGGAGLSGAASDMAVYRDQLAEIDRDLARGALPPEEAEAARIEVSRRLLDADRRDTQAGSGTAGPGRLGAAALALALLGGAFGLYAYLGAPGDPDQPIAERLAAIAEARANRPGQAEAEARAAPFLPRLMESDAKFAALMTKLRAAVAARPGDTQGLALLAQSEARLGNYAAARDAQAKLLAAKGATASIEDRLALLDIMVYATGGFVSPEAEAVLNGILYTDPKNPDALYYAGLLEAQTGRPDRAFPIWRQLVETGPQDAPWMPVVRSEISAVAAAAGIDYTPPSAPEGPSAADMAAAQDMTPEERQSMIQGMVQRLSDRLASDGGPPEDWARLITSLGVLGNTEKARAIAGEAEQVFSDHPDALATIAAARTTAGIADAPASPGPTADDVAAAQAMPPADRQAMIAGMVQQLSDRLDAQGGPASDWARLITSLGVLGEADKAREAVGKAEAAYAGNTAALAEIAAARAKAGIAE